MRSSQILLLWRRVSSDLLDRKDLLTICWWSMSMVPSIIINCVWNLHLFIICSIQNLSRSYLSQLDLNPYCHSTLSIKTMTPSIHSSSMLCLWLVFLVFSSSILLHSTLMITFFLQSLYDHDQHFVYFVNIPHSLAKIILFINFQNHFENLIISHFLEH